LNIGRTAALAFADIIVRFLTKGETLALPAVISRTNAQLPLSKARREHKVKPPLEFCMMFDPHSDEALSALQAAVVQDDATEAQRLLAAGVDPNKAAGRSRPQNALQVAVRLRRGRQIELLLDFGAQPSLYCAPVTALGLAAYDFYFQGVELVAARGPDLRLLLLPEHTPDQALHRTTLLHRLMERPANSISPLPQQRSRKRLRPRRKNQNCFVFGAALSLGERRAPAVELRRTVSVGFRDRRRRAPSPSRMVRHRHRGACDPLSDRAVRVREGKWGSFAPHTPRRATLVKR